MNYNAWGISWGQSWNGAWGESVIPQQSAASGIRRLQLYKLQEEELIKKAFREAAKEVISEKTIVDSGELVKLQTTSPKNKKQSKPVVPENRQETEKPIPIIPFRKVPAKLEPTAYDELAKLPPIVLEYYLSAMRMSTVIVLKDERRKRQKHRRKVAAFLLMAA